jgi:hypothetical protein
MLKEIFLDLLTKYTDSKSLISELWIEIEKYYGDKKDIIILYSTLIIY